MLTGAAARGGLAWRERAPSSRPQLEARLHAPLGERRTATEQTACACTDRHSLPRAEQARSVHAGKRSFIQQNTSLTSPRTEHYSNFSLGYFTTKTRFAASPTFFGKYLIHIWNATPRGADYYDKNHKYLAIERAASSQAVHELISLSANLLP